jgi:hypothetical protein
MNILKHWNGSAWVPVVVGGEGPQGVPGPQGEAWASTFESIAKNLSGLPVIASTFSPGVSLVKTWNSGDGTSITMTVLFSGGLPTTKTLSGTGLPSGIPTVCTYDFSGRVIPLTTYT